MINDPVLRKYQVRVLSYIPAPFFSELLLRAASLVHLPLKMYVHFWPPRKNDK